MPAIGKDQFAALMQPLGPFEKAPNLAVAVSGGADSMALALLAHAWAQQRGGAITALTVDHGLRRAAAGEARQVRAWLQAHGIDHQTLRWRGVKPGSGIQAAARQARYALLGQWCRRRAWGGTRSGTRRRYLIPSVHAPRPDREGQRIPSSATLHLQSLGRRRTTHHFVPQQPLETDDPVQKVAIRRFAPSSDSMYPE